MRHRHVRHAKASSLGAILHICNLRRSCFDHNTLIAPTRPIFSTSNGRKRYRREAAGAIEKEDVSGYGSNWQIE